MNKTVVITGASSGIGAALAIEYAKKKWQIVLAARSVEKLNEIAKECENLGAKILVTSCDVSKKTDCENLINQTIEKFKHIDVLINNAGISMRALFNDCKTDVLEQLMAVNFWGAVYCTKYALPYLLKTKGSVVGVSSIAGIKGLPARTGYSASKFALHGFLESLRIENLKTGLHVLVACPGYTASNIRNSALNSNGNAQSESPLNEQKLMSAEKVATNIIAAIEKRKSYTYMSLEGKMLYYLNKFFPLLMDKIVYNKVSKETNSPF